MVSSLVSFPRNNKVKKISYVENLNDIKQEGKNKNKKQEKY